MLLFIEVTLLVLAFFDLNGVGAIFIGVGDAWPNASSESSLACAMSARSCSSLICSNWAAMA